MQLYDISLGISPDLPVWPGDPPVVLERTSSLEEGADANVSRLACSVHTGTHVDAPVHFLENGKAIEDLPLKTLIGRAYVVELAKAKVLDEATLEAAGIPPRTRRVLFKTRNSELWAQGRKSFYEDYVALDATGARWLASKGFHLVGIDYLSIAHYREPVEPHQILLSEGVVLLEGLNLDQVSQGRYTLYCLPMKILGSDGAPARAILAGV